MFQLNSILFGRDDVDEASAQIIVSIVNKLCKRDALSGTISIPAASTAKIALYTSSFTPQVYSETQQQLAISFYKTNGYLKFTSFGISRSKIQVFMTQSLVSRYVLIYVSFVETKTELICLITFHISAEFSNARQLAHY